MTNNGLVPDDLFMSRRLQVATQLMAGLMVSFGEDQGWVSRDLATTSLYAADELIKQEEASRRSA